MPVYSQKHIKWDHKSSLLSARVGSQHGNLRATDARSVWGHTLIWRLDCGVFHVPGSLSWGVCSALEPHFFPSPVLRAGARWSFAAEAVLCLVGWSAPSQRLPTRCQLHPHLLILTIRHISRYYQVSPGGQISLVENHCLGALLRVVFGEDGL